MSDILQRLENATSRMDIDLLEISEAAAEIRRLRAELHSAGEDIKSLETCIEGLRASPLQSLVEQGPAEYARHLEIVEAITEDNLLSYVRRNALREVLSRLATLEQFDASKIQDAALGLVEKLSRENAELLTAVESERRACADIAEQFDGDRADGLEHQLSAGTIRDLILARGKGATCQRK